MPNILEFKDLGAKGINTDLPTWSLPLEYISDGINFRISSGTISSVKPFVLFKNKPASVNPGMLMYVADTDWLYAGMSVYLTDGATWTDVSSVGGYPSQNQDGWSGGKLGKLAVLNNDAYYPQYIDLTAVSPIMTDLPWDAGNTWSAVSKQCKIMRPYKNFLFALNLTESAVNYPNAYRWSTPSDINGVPFTWDETDLSGLASREQLGGEGGDIIDGRQLKDSFVIYSRNQVNVLNYVGDEFVFSRRTLPGNNGLVSKDALVEAQGVHYFLSDGDIFVNDGNTVSPITYKKLQKRLTGNANNSFYYRSFAFANTLEKEVWFCVPEGTSEWPNVAYIYNWLEQGFSIRNITPCSSMAYGQIPVVSKTWATTSGTWNYPDFKWGSDSTTPLNATMLGVEATTGDLLTLSDEQTVEESYIERLGLPIEGHNTVTTITRIYPHIKGSQTLTIQVGSQQLAGGPVLWKPSVTFNPSVDRKVDLRTTGSLHCYRIVASQSGAWEFSGMTIEYELAGTR